MNHEKLWDHVQNRPEMAGAFDGATPRYQYLARQVASGEHVLNVGVGRGGLEELLNSASKSKFLSVNG